MAPVRGFARLVRTALPALAAMGCGVLAAIVPVSPASADPTLDQLWDQAEAVIEQSNQVSLELKANRAKQADLEKSIAPLQQQIDAAMATVSQLSAQAYKSGNVFTLTSLMTSGSPNTLLDQLNMIDTISRQRLAEITDAKSVKDKYSTDKKALDELVDKQAKQEADLAAKKKDIDTKIKALESARKAATGSTTVKATSGELKPTDCPVDGGSGAGFAAAQKACSKIGAKYVYGSSGPDTFDCSGLTMWSWAGSKSLPHNAASQYSSITHIGKDQLQPGDLVFYYSPIHHVGIYVGGGYIVHAPQTGDVVRMASVDRGSTSTYYGRPA